MIGDILPIIGPTRSANDGIFGPVPRDHRQRHGADEPERVRIREIGLGPEEPAADPRATDHHRVHPDLRHRSVRQRSHLYRHPAEPRHANRNQLLSVQSGDIRSASLNSW